MSTANPASTPAGDPIITIQDFWVQYDILHPVIIGSIGYIGLISLTTVLILEYLFAWATIRLHRLRPFVRNHPILLAYEGKFNRPMLLRNRLSEEDVWMALRQKGHATLKSAHAVVLEGNGEFSIIEKGVVWNEKGCDALRKVVGYEKAFMEVWSRKQSSATLHGLDGDGGQQDPKQHLDLEVQMGEDEPSD
ncbi:hypothetical protein HK104_005054 [Borealophlyctis nickersoniae]|nr:hypothetical protein HK104_005054 [Borealophlyctis nickersoniae]